MIMRRTTVPIALLALSFLGLSAGLIFAYGCLPVRVASHFDAAGHPNGWISRNHYLWTFGGTAFGLSGFMLLVFYCIRFFPPSMINLPRRDYWLASERREETFGFVFCAGIWFACSEVLFMLGLHLLIVNANAVSPPHLGPGVWLLGVLFLASVGTWVFILIRRFYQAALT
jgi:hypothetical protein